MAAPLIGDMRLVDADTGEQLILSPSAGNGGLIKVVDFDPGFPGVRSVRVPNPGWNGESDYTSLHGAKVAALVLRLHSLTGGPVMSTLSTLRSWASPARNVWLFYTPLDMAERVLYLKGDQLGAPLPLTVMTSGVVDVQVQWVVPDGVEYSAATTETTVMLQSAMTTGRTYPLVYPRTYAAQDGTGVATIFNAGTVDTAPIIRIFGPVVGPRIVNEATGLVLEFLGLSVGSTEYIEIDMAAKTVQLQGVPGADANRRSALTTRQWWTLRPGDNIIRFTGTSGGTPSQALVLSQDAWI